MLTKRMMWAAALLSLLLVTGCGDGKNKNDGAAGADSLAAGASEKVALWEAENDSTIYGRADGFGQSAFTLIADDGRELDIALTSEAGEPHEGVIYGAREDTARYAVTTRDAGEALGVMINLSQLDRFGLAYQIHNCHLVIDVDGTLTPVEILDLSDDRIVVRDEAGRERTFKH